VNFLAHFHIADVIRRRRGEADHGLLVGALLGDHVKGPLKGEYPSHWEQGIRLHRRIDALTDSDPATRQCLRAFPAHFRRYGGIALDVCYDHFLSRHWQADWLDTVPQALAAFSEQCYQQLQADSRHFPQAARRQSRFLAEYNVLCSLQDWHNIERTLARIARRLQRDNPLSDCGAILTPMQGEIEASFLALYPRLLAQLSDEFANGATA